MLVTCLISFTIIKVKKFDTVLCLGIYYHVMDHSHLLRLIARMRPETIIIDSGFVRSSVIRFMSKPRTLILKMLWLCSRAKRIPVGFISLGLMIQLALEFGIQLSSGYSGSKRGCRTKTCSRLLNGATLHLKLQKIDGNTDDQWKDTGSLPWRLLSRNLLSYSMLKRTIVNQMIGLGGL